MSDPQQDAEASGANHDPIAGSATPEGAPEGGTPLEQAEARIRVLEESLAAAGEEAKNQHARMLRLAADLDNHRKRAAREVEDATRSGQQGALTKLLPVFDNLERATAHLGENAEPATLAEGIRMVMKQFAEALARLGIERIDALGKPFDPMVHESIQYEHHAAIPAAHVSQELQAGYRQGESLLRPALVVVSKGPASPDSN